MGSILEGATTQEMRRIIKAMVSRACLDYLALTNEETCRTYLATWNAAWTPQWMADERADLREWLLGDGLRWAMEVELDEYVLEIVHGNNTMRAARLADRGAHAVTRRDGLVP